MRRHQTDRYRRQRGQAAVEWVLTLPIIILMIMGLYQVLMFERDVFNKMNLARYQAFKRAHAAQNTAEMKAYEVIEIKTQGKKVSELTGFRMPVQAVKGERRYGPKIYYFGCGTKRFFPGGDTGETVMEVAEVAAVILDHFQETHAIPKAGAKALGALGKTASAIPCEQASGFIGKLNGALDIFNF